jgi:adenosylcobinamide-phosphate guanylyltransferase
MLALVMAGGRGSRLMMGEKALVRLCDRPLIDYVLTTLENAGFDPLVVTTPRTPYTANYCRMRGVDQICTEGIGYIEDIAEAIELTAEVGPALIICVDTPGLCIEHLDKILSTYFASGKDACSVWIPASLMQESGCSASYIQMIGDTPAIPAGINILLGERIDEEQDEVPILIEDPALAFNINTQTELKLAESFFSQKSDPLRLTGLDTCSHK